MCSNLINSFCFFCIYVPEKNLCFVFINSWGGIATSADAEG
ncbi:hypothetical protein HMPREF1981_01858 [Bacteroides pyogenes F0041]|uniref:Uncharacterized protein n=1 Tax=Bacteroides pyogenes F0041 TaxID=1321819 RepID=U2DZD8_9BACE|nr:hypothetical protein HMPREF1981_01858 [Bacteroides pyogenes F0041]